MFQKEADKRRESASKLIRDAMSEYKDRHLSRQRSIFDHEPVSVGSVLKDLGPEDDLLEEMSD